MCALQHTIEIAIFFNFNEILMRKIFINKLIQNFIQCGDNGK